MGYLQKVFGIKGETHPQAKAEATTRQRHGTPKADGQASKQEQAQRQGDRTTTRTDKATKDTHTRIFRPNSGRFGVFAPVSPELRASSKRPPNGATSLSSRRQYDQSRVHFNLDQCRGFCRSHAQFCRHRNRGPRSVSFQRPARGGPR